MDEKVEKADYLLIIFAIYTVAILYAIQVVGFSAGMSLTLLIVDTIMLIVAIKYKFEAIRRGKK